ncbi:sarcosine oxidase subunit delta [Roseobacter ponti]|uniref:Sarcosine oxidase subunit delta n=1 Tax=Roseobacter ponti TaxID=1891787 RepID=A0A858SP99_9RHOB|nr:sarcosine oxidase subunit delta [Roseobacter ponti]QJF50669.1 sarcosine oxidase subunit delta [Roseobacter ponti]
MRLTCPVCGERDRREFYYQGAAVAMNRPSPDAGAEAWDNYVHLRENPAGETRDMWQHDGGCGAWLVVTRNTVTHEISDVSLASDPAGESV